MTSKIAKEAFEFQNQIRQDPQSAIPILEGRLQYFKGNTLNLPDTDCGLTTEEGPAAYLECIEFLKSQKPLPLLEYSKGIERACQDHCDDIGPKGILNHQGSDGSSMTQRIERYGQVSYCGENISCGDATGQEVIISLIVDDGVQSRGHRENIFREEYQYVGIASGPHQAYGHVCVLDYAGTFAEGNDQLQQDA